jgi:DNA-binding CsgD family transcriptional regulator
MSLKNKISSLLRNNTFDFIKISNILFYLLIIILIIINLYDIIFHILNEGSLNLHQKLEATILFFITILIFLIRIYHISKFKKLSSEVLKKEKEVSIYKKKYKNSIKQIKKGIEEQFNYWQFTQEEKKIAKYLILGYSFKQIAGMLNKSEKTVRNQSLSIYKKSGMISRNDLAGFFLYDFFEEET